MTSVPAVIDTTATDDQPTTAPIILVGGITDPEVCKRQAAALRAAAKHSPIAQVAGPLRARAIEWDRAAADLIEVTTYGDDCMVCLVGSIEPGMHVVVGLKRHRVIRLMQSGGQTSVHCEPVDEPPRPEYVNCMGPTSPIVVLT